MKTENEVPFIEFPKIARLARQCVVTEKIDGTNAQIYIGENGEFLTGSRSRWITPENDNYGFSRWAHDNKEELGKPSPFSSILTMIGSKVATSMGKMLESRSPFIDILERKNEK